MNKATTWILGGILGIATLVIGVSAILMNPSQQLAFASQAYTGGNGTGNEPICGNGIVEFGEACDDGNTNNFDTCSNECILVLGTGATGEYACPRSLTITGPLGSATLNHEGQAITLDAGVQYALKCTANYNGVPQAQKINFLFSNGIRTRINNPGQFTFPYNNGYYIFANCGESVGCSYKINIPGPFCGDNICQANEIDKFGNPICKADCEGPIKPETPIKPM